MSTPLPTSTVPTEPSLDRTTLTNPARKTPSAAVVKPVTTPDPDAPPSFVASSPAAPVSSARSGSKRAPASRTAASHSAGSSTSPHHISSLSSSSASPRVVFGSGTISRLPTELGRLRLSSPLIVSSPSRVSLARRVQALIPNLDTRILDSTLVSVPQRTVEEAVARIAKRDCVISIGGTSAVKLSGAIASRYKIPHICVPTSYSGSEAPLAGMPRRRESKSRRRKSSALSSGASSSGSSRRSSSTNTDAEGNHMPAIVIYDEELTSTGTPMRFSAPTGPKSEESRSNRDPKDDDAQWSYIHLPGV